MRRTFRFETLEGRVLRSAAVTDPGHNLHVAVGQTINIDPTSPLDIDYVAPKSVKWDLNYDGEHFDADLSGAQPRVAFDHAGEFVVAGSYDYGNGQVEMRTFEVEVTDYASEAPDPMIHVAAPDHAAAGEAVVFTLWTDHDGESVQYILDNDGYSGPNAPAEITRTFAHPGNYDLKVQLYTDGEYAGYASYSITITATQVTPLQAYVAPPALVWSMTPIKDDADLLA